MLLPGLHLDPAKIPAHGARASHRGAVRRRRDRRHAVRGAALLRRAAYAYRFELDGRVLTYSGDTEWADTLVPAARGADLFICEAYFFAKQVKWHLDYATLHTRLGEIGAKRTMLTHMSAELLDRLGEVVLKTAEDGKWVEV